ncbi:MAG: hypothetical protein Q8J99_14140 [Sulfuritalea sp.]|nr:hypothetical protein [Sulfuritalea sp.]
MSLAKYIQVSTSYTRSINIERDLESSEGGRPYIPTSRALQTLGRIAETLHENPAQRAWALIGPYGSGKSAFGLFLSNLLSAVDKSAAKAACTALEQAAPALGKRFRGNIRKSAGFCLITITGSPEPLTQRLAQAMLASAEAFRGIQRGAVPSFIRELRSAIEGGADIPVGNLVDWMSDLQGMVLKTGGKGILLVIDELGKFLEYEARHRQSTDIYLLQALAEHACAANRAPLLLVVLLHQTFEQYFVTLGDQLKNEWKKVQGRFESIPFLESSEQILRIVKAALNAELPNALAKAVAAETKRIVSRLNQSHALPQGLDAKAAGEIFTGSYPLHPASLLMLPTLCQKVAQNERTLFSYLGSTEPHGFQEALNRLEDDAKQPQWVMPWEIYEYFILNQPGLVSDQITHRRWAEVITAVERLGDAPEPVIRLLKTIGLLNIAGAQGGLKASEELLRLTHDAKDVAFDEALNVLLDRSIVTFRRFSGEYRVWQGSDFDLEAALQEQRDQLGRIELAKLLNEREVITPIVARRHAIETGTLRYFKPQFVDSVSGIAAPPKGEPTLLLCLAETRESEGRYVDALRELGAVPSVIGAVVANAASLRQAVTEVIAFQRIQRQYPEVNSDPVATRELKDRLAVASEQEHEILSAIVEEPENSFWWWCGLDHRLDSKRGLQNLLSRALEKTFDKSPHIHNELVNRDKPSSTANAARKKLLIAMLENAHKEDLGFDKFPAEKAMYRSLLSATGIHAPAAEAWCFQAPTADRKYVLPAWHAIEAFVESTEQSPRPLQDLFALLAQTPYGIKQGVLPILFLAFYLANSEELALFDGGHYCPFISQEIVERIIKEPHVFAVQGFKTDHVRDSIFRTYIESVSPMGDSPSQVNLIAAAKPFAKFMMALPDYARTTKTISPEAQLLRDRFFASKSPAQLLFFQIPEAFGLRPLIGEAASPIHLTEFARKLKSTVGELRVAYHAVLMDFLNQLRGIFFLNPSDDLDRVRELLAGRHAGLQDYTIDVQGLKAFIGRLTDTYGDEKQWLISLASFLARKPPEKWNDEDAAAAKYRLFEFAKKIRELETLRLHSQRREDKATDFELILLKTISQSAGETEAVVALDEEKRQRVATTVTQVTNLLGELGSEDLKNAVLAMLLSGQSSDGQAKAIVDQASGKEGSANA